MASADDILDELGLAPRWVLRTGTRSGTAAQAAVRAPPVAVARAGATPAGGGVARADAGSPHGDRAMRIARMSLEELSADVATCTACGLCRSRKHAVPGVGDARAEWLFIGEAPGAEEDLRGEPFVGQAGKLLDNMLAALGLSRERNVYIANVLKCRPPNNRTPEPSEVSACAPYLARQVELLAPRIIVALGRSAAAQLLGSDASIAALRGRVHRHQGIALVVTYHPAYLLRSLADKAKAWDDLLLARRALAPG